MTLKLNFFAKSDRGLIRDNNEDSGYAGPHLLILAVVWVATRRARWPPS